jgi:hypothetical protein
MGRTLRQVHARSVALLSEGLAQLRIFPGANAAAIARGPYRALYPHSIGTALACIPDPWSVSQHALLLPLSSWLQQEGKVVAILQPLSSGRPLGPWCTATCVERMALGALV